METSPGKDQGSRRALVTGGGVRVGRAIALALGEAGFDVAVHYRSSEKAAKEVVHLLRERGCVARAIAADLSDPAQIRGLFEQLASDWDHLDLLVNNAAIFPRSRPEDTPAEEWDSVLALNLRAPFLCAQEARKLMTDDGSIVNIADVAAFEAWPGYAAYAASKAGLVSLTRSLALAWAPEIRVNAVAPGAVLLPEGTDEEGHRTAARRTVLGRIGHPRDVASAVLYLADANFVTGEVMRVDGGGQLKRTTGLP